MVIIFISFKAGEGQPSALGQNPRVMRAAPRREEEAQGGFGQPRLSRGSGTDGSINPGGGRSCVSQ